MTQDENAGDPKHENPLEDSRLYETQFVPPPRTGVDEIPYQIRFQANYSQLELYGKGGLGIVCSAHDSQLNRRVAIKLVRNQFEMDPMAVQQFSIEAEITGRLDHPGVAPVFTSGISEDGKPFYAMRFIDGRDLTIDVDEFHCNGTPDFDSVEFRDLLQRFVSVCKTIAYAHNRGIVHRDIKPQNIRVGRFGETVVLDWGLAIVVNRTDHFKQSGEATMILASDNSNSSSSSGAGTPAFMSPEQLSGLAATPASDIYSLGATLYKIITGHTTVDELHVDNLRDALIDGRWRKPIEIQPAIPKQLAAICEKAMANRPTDRFITAMELAADVERYLAGSAVSCYAEAPTEKLSRWARKHQSWIRYGVLLLVTLVAISFLTALYMMNLADSRETERLEAVEQRKEASQAREEATIAKRQAQLMSARLAARSIAAEIELRGAVLREEAASQDLRRLTETLNDKPQSEEDLKELDSLLKDRFIARVTDAMPTTSWCVYLADGTQIARIARDGSDKTLSLNKNFRHRDYFHAHGQEFKEGSPEALSAKPHSFGVHVSSVFLSSNSQRLSVAFTVPIFSLSTSKSDRQVIGLFFASVHLNKLDLLEGSMLVDIRTDKLSGSESTGLILRHPDINEIEKLRPNYPRLDPVTVGNIKTIHHSKRNEKDSSASEKLEPGFIQFEDPITRKPSIAAVEPIVLSNQEDHSEVGWAILLREQ